MCLCGSIMKLVTSVGVHVFLREAGGYAVVLMLFLRLSALFMCFAYSTSSKGSYSCSCRVVVLLMECNLEVSLCCVIMENGRAMS